MFTFIDITYRIKNKNMVYSSFLRFKANMLSWNKTFTHKPLDKSPIRYFCYNFIYTIDIVKPR